METPRPEKSRPDDSSWFAWLPSIFSSASSAKPAPPDASAEQGGADAAGGGDSGGGDGSGGCDGGGGGGD